MTRLPLECYAVVAEDGTIIGPMTDRALADEVATEHLAELVVLREVPTCKTCLVFYTNASLDKPACVRLMMVPHDGSGFCSEHIAGSRHESTEARR